MIRLSVALLSAALPLAPVQAGDAQHPVVVELFQSQGCSSCPPAIANINAVAGRADVLALTFAVTYWDQLGWKDTFARPAFTDRQWQYARAAGRPQVATPQTIVDGRTAINGGDRAELDRTIRAARRGATGPALAARGGIVAIGAARSAAPATVWLVRYDPRTIAVPIRAGENNGRTLDHRNVVRSLEPIGTWNGRALHLRLPAGGAPDLRAAILVQQGSGGPIIAAGRLPA